MPKTEIDYSNTIIYKITCKDPEIKDVYVGHTTNFVQRKHAHKQGCNNSKSSNYDCKLYNTIREKGGWVNWKMEIINFFNCSDHYEARKKEQEYFESLNANLNSIEPMPKPKVKQFTICNVCNINCHTMKGLETHNNTNKHNKRIANNQIIESTNNIECDTTSIQENAGKYVCENCNFKCCKLSNWNIHISTTKHKNRTKMNSLEQKTSNKLYKCKYCDKEYKARNSLWYHENKCNIIVKQETVEKSSDNQQLLDYLIKQNQEFQKQILDICKNKMIA
jgi:hypothetical protein